jgi:DHA1 family multidrug resistance protein-like MFS transporter
LVNEEITIEMDDAQEPFQEGNVITVLNLSLVTFCVLLGLSMVAPILPTYAESFQVSYTFVGFVVSAFAVTRMILDMPAGLLARKFDKKAIMITGLILLSTSSILAGLAPNYITLVIARMIEGAGSALYVTTATVFLAQISGEEKRGQWMSLYMGMLLLGAIFGPTFGGILSELYDIRMPFFAYAIMTGLAISPTLVLPKLTNSQNSSILESGTVLRDVKEVLSNRSFLLVTFAIFTTFFLRTGVRSTLLPLFGTNNLGLTSGDIGIVLTIGGITTAITITPMGSVSDRIGRKIPLALCLVLSALVVLVIPLLSTDFLTFAVLLGVYGAVIGFSGPSAAYITDVSPQDKLEISMGLYRMISDFGFVMGPLLLGFLADLTATPVPGEPHSGLIGFFPFLFVSLLLIAAVFVLAKADDPAKELARKKN